MENYDGELIFVTSEFDDFIFYCKDNFLTINSNGIIGATEAS